MEKNHEERRIKLKAEIDSLFQDDEETVTFSDFRSSLSSDQQSMHLQQLAMAQAAQSQAMQSQIAPNQIQGYESMYSNQGMGALGQAGLGNLLGGLL